MAPVKQENLHRKIHKSPLIPMERNNAPDGRSWTSITWLLFILLKCARYFKYTKVRTGLANTEGAKFDIEGAFEEIRSFFKNDKLSLNLKGNLFDNLNHCFYTFSSRSYFAREFLSKTNHNLAGRVRGY